MAEGVPPRSRQCIPRSGKAALGRAADRPTGTQSGPADPGDRFFKGVLAANRGTAEAAGTDWKAATCQHTQKQTEEGVAMKTPRRCQPGHISRASLYRFAPDAEHADPDLDLRDE